MPEEEAKRKRGDDEKWISASPAGAASFPDNEESGSKGQTTDDSGTASGSSVGNEDPASNDGRKEDEGRAFLNAEMAGNADRGNDEKPSGGAAGKFSGASRRPARRERPTLPAGKELLSVRYVKMRENKSESNSEKENEGSGSKPREIPEMSERSLEQIFGVKAEWGKGERWVKLTDEKQQQQQDVECEGGGGGGGGRETSLRYFEGETESEGGQKVVEMKKNEVRGEKNEVRGDKNEVRKEENKVRGEENKVRGDKNEVSGEKNEVIGEKNEVREEQSEVRGEENEAAGKQEIGTVGTKSPINEEAEADEESEKTRDLEAEKEDEMEAGRDVKRKKSEEREKSGKEKSRRRRFSSENVGARLARTRNLVRTDCISLARGIRARRKEKSAALKCSLERRVESVEKILEDRVETFLEVTAEKHPWLQPLETWIVDRYKSARAPRPIEGIATRASSPESEMSESREKRDEEVQTDGADGGEIFIEKIVEPKTEEKQEERKGSVSSAGSSPDLGKSRGGRAGTTGKVERSHHVDLLDKLRDGFKEKYEDVQRYFQRTSRLADVNRKLKSQIWSSVVTIVLVEAKNLLPMDIDGLSDPYVKFRLGTEKYKSKVVNKTLSPVWLEQFDLHLYEDPYLGQELEVTVWDRDKSHQDDLMGRTTINLASMERETTHRLWRDLEDGAGNIYLLLTISGTTASETISDLAAHEETPQERARLLQKYSLRNTLQRPRDVGHLTVKVYRAQGLAAADLGGKSDPFCVLELVNARLQTQTEYKTLAPNWQKIFTFNVKDINSVLEVTVYDEDRDHKVEFLGRVAIPLLRIRNAEKRWYALKDKKLRGRAKGNSPQIMLEMIVVWNVLRACARTLNPKEKKYMEPEVKFKRQVFLRNVLRLKAVIVFFIDLGKYIQSCWEWESKTRSIVALVLFVLLCYYFEPWMIPTAALLILMKYCMVAMLTGGSFATSYQHSPSVGQLHDSGDAASDEGPPTPGDDDDDEDDKDKEEKKSLKERLQAIQEVTQTVQNSIGYIASLCERIKNLFNFTVPYLSYLAMFLTILGVIVLYLVPMRYLILAWGVNKFLRKLLRPHSVPNNEVLDLISRVPDDEDLHSYRELKPVPTADCERGGIASTSGSGVATTATRRDHRKKHKAA